MKFLENYNRADLRKVRPQSLTLLELRAHIGVEYPALFLQPWFEKELHDLWSLGSPDPQREGRRLILPTQWRKFAREVGQRVGVSIHGAARG